MSETHMIVLAMKLSSERMRLEALLKATSECTNRCAELLEEVTREARDIVVTADRRIEEIKRLATLTPAESA